MAACVAQPPSKSGENPPPSGTLAADGHETTLGWWLESVSGRELTVAIELGDPTCLEFDRTVVRESKDSVDITAIGTVLKTQACFTVRRFHPMSIVLDEPLGDRSLAGCQLGEAAYEPRTRCDQIAEH